MTNISDIQEERKSDVYLGEVNTAGSDKSTWRKEDEVKRANGGEV